MKIQQRLCLSVAASAALSLSAAFAAAQNQPTHPAAASAPASSGPISLPVTVVNDHGDPVKNLTPAGLTLVDNGHVQKVDSFALAQPSPMTIGIIAQTSNALRYEIGDERLATVHFVDHTIPGSDNKFFVVQFASEVDLLEDPTATVNKLHDAINQLGSRQFGNQEQTSGDQQSADHPRGGGFGGTLYDAIYLACTEVLKQQPGRHILIVITDGVDRGSKVTMSEAIQSAQDTDTMVYSIYYKGEVERQNNPAQDRGRRSSTGPTFPFPGGGGGYPRGGSQPVPREEPQQPSVDGEKILEQLGNATGGYKVVGKHDKADDAYKTIGDLLKNQYILTWTPDSNTASSSSHHLTLTAKEKGVYPIVQSNYTTQH